MLDPRPPAAVAAGNVETSQCIVDALYGALGILAASQGTMNNLTFGDARLQYYETICGGAGAGPDFDGCDAVHTHMTNSRLTDPEILEARVPGAGARVCDPSRFGRRRPPPRRRWHAAPARVPQRASAAHCSPITGASRPSGSPAGSPGHAARRHIRRADGRRETLGATASFEVEPGDELSILTPGGGGFGSAD